MDIKENYDLTKLNTFGVVSHAKFFTEINTEFDIKEVLNSKHFKNSSKLFLGSGSNILFTKDFEGIVILNKLKGIEILEENSEYVLVKSMSGEIWHELVMFIVNNGFWGVENLSFVPGTVGAAPVQNIGAYGVELKNILESVDALNIDTGEIRIFKNTECEFGYRDSIFKNKFKNKYSKFNSSLNNNQI